MFWKQRLCFRRRMFKRLILIFTALTALSMLASRFYAFHRILTTFLSENYLPYYFAPLNCSPDGPIIEHEGPIIPGKYIVALDNGYPFHRHLTNVGDEILYHMDSKRNEVFQPFMRDDESIYFVYGVEDILLWKIRREWGTEMVLCDTIRKPSVFQRGIERAWSVWRTVGSLF